MSFRPYDVSVFSRKPVSLTTVPSTPVFVDPPQGIAVAPACHRPAYSYTAFWKRTVLRLLDGVSVCIAFHTHTLRALQGLSARIMT